ncbi:hypothetical protein D3C71_328850 [compost metagenome]
MPTYATSSDRAFLERNSRLDADLALAALESGIEADDITYAFSVAVTPDDWAAAHAVGLARTALAKTRGRYSSAYRRGADDERIDTEGAIAEIALYAVLDRSEALTAPLVTYRPEPAADLEFEGYSFDVKSVSQSKTRVCINARAHNSRPVSAYVLARITSERVIDVYVVGHAAVDRWRLAQGHSPYYTSPMPPAPPFPLAED